MRTQNAGKHIWKFSKTCPTRLGAARKAAAAPSLLAVHLLRASLGGSLGERDAWLRRVTIMDFSGWSFVARRIEHTWTTYSSLNSISWVNIPFQRFKNLTSKWSFKPPSLFNIWQRSSTYRWVESASRGQQRRWGFLHGNTFLHASNNA